MSNTIKGSASSRMLPKIIAQNLNASQKTSQAARSKHFSRVQRAVSDPTHRATKARAHILGDEVLNNVSASGKQSPYNASVQAQLYDIFQKTIEFSAHPYAYTKEMLTNQAINFAQRMLPLELQQKIDMIFDSIETVTKAAEEVNRLGKRLNGAIDGISSVKNALVQTTTESFNKLKNVATGGAYYINLTRAKTKQALVPVIMRQSANASMFFGSDPLTALPKELKNNKEFEPLIQEYREICHEAFVATKRSLAMRTKFLAGEGLKVGISAAALTALFSALGTLVVALANRRAMKSEEKSASASDALPDCDLTQLEDFSELEAIDSQLGEALHSSLETLIDPSDLNAELKEESSPQLISEFKEIYNAIPPEYRADFLEAFASNVLIWISEQSSSMGSPLPPNFLDDQMEQAMQRAQKAFEEEAAQYEENEAAETLVSEQISFATGAEYGAIIGATLGGIALIGRLISSEKKIRKNQWTEDESLANAKIAHELAQKSRANARAFFDTKLRPLVEHTLDQKILKCQESENNQKSE